MNVRRDDSGFTISELLTGLGMFSVVGAAITSVVIGTFNTVAYQARIADAQLDVASAMVLVQDDLRTAGYVVDNMNQSFFQQITTGTNSDSIRFAGDVNSDDVSERITYSVAGGQLMRTQDVWDGSNGWIAGTAQPLAADVTTFRLNFYQVDPCNGTVTQQTATQVINSQKTSFVMVTLTGVGSYKGRSVSRTLTSNVAWRQDNVLPRC